MRIEMKEGEREILKSMLEGPITPAVSMWYARLRRRLLLAGHNYDMPKEFLALIVELSVTAAPNMELPEPTEPRERTDDAPDPTPVDELPLSERDALEAQNADLNPDATGGEYQGAIGKYVNVFKSTPRTPISKLEKGRPITYVSPNDGRERSARFVRINKYDKSKANIVSAEMKKAFPVPIRNITVTDLSPPSRMPLAVQI